MAEESENRQMFLARVASLYYEAGKNQQQIADTLGVSRSAVSRFLTEARERGIVEIIVHYPWRTNNDLEENIRTKFNLTGIRVLDSKERDYDEMLQGLGTLAAEELDSIVTPESVIGMAWGTALYQLLRFVRPHRFPSLEVVQMIGAMGSDHKLGTDSPVLVQLLAGRLGGFYRHLHAPLIVETTEAHSALMGDRTIKETLARAEAADIALIGIGSTRPELYSLLRSGYVDKDETVRIREKGAVGDICGQHFDQNGREIDVGVSRRSIAIGLEHLKKIPTVLAVAGSEMKGDAILAALRGGYVHVLITDDAAARWVVEHMEMQ
jgi:deoxyribonucleoside regulator